MMGCFLIGWEHSLSVILGEKGRNILIVSSTQRNCFKGFYCSAPRVARNITSLLDRPVKEMGGPNFGLVWQHEAVGVF